MVRCAAAWRETLEGEGGQHDDAGLPHNCRRDAANPSLPGPEEPGMLGDWHRWRTHCDQADLALAWALRYQKLLN